MRAIIVPAVVSVMSFCGYHAYQSHSARGPERGFGHTARQEVRTAEAGRPDHRLTPYGHDRIDVRGGCEGFHHRHGDHADHAARPEHFDQPEQQQRL